MTHPMLREIEELVEITRRYATNTAEDPCYYTVLYVNMRRRNALEAISKLAIDKTYAPERMFSGEAEVRNDYNIESMSAYSYYTSIFRHDWYANETWRVWKNGAPRYICVENSVFNQPTVRIFGLKRYIEI